jgi:hypothetical protein
MDSSTVASTIVIKKLTMMAGKYTARKKQVVGGAHVIDINVDDDMLQGDLFLFPGIFIY